MKLVQADTDALIDSTRAALRGMLDAAFEGDFSDDDWDHALGGRHVLVVDKQCIVAHAAVVERTLQLGADTVKAGYVEAVATHAAHRHQGHGSVVMKAVHRIVEADFEVGALCTGKHGFYERFGWVRWRGPTFVIEGNSRRRTPEEDDAIMVLPTSRTPAMDLSHAIVCDWRRGDVW